MTFSPVNRSRLQASISCAVAGFVWWRTGRPTFAFVWGALLLLASISWFAPRRYTPVQHTIDRLSRWLLSGITWIILALVYFALFTPLRMWHSLVGRDPLQLRRTSVPSSYLRALPAFSQARFNRQY